jgi:hypothetical protein
MVEAQVHECECRQEKLSYPSGDTDCYLPKCRHHLYVVKPPRTSPSSTATSFCYMNADTTDDEQITWHDVMFHSWKRLNTVLLVTCDSVANRKTLRNSRYSTSQSQKTVLGKRTIWIPILMITKISSFVVVTRQNRVNHLRKGVRILSFYDVL